MGTSSTSSEITNSQIDSAVSERARVRKPALSLAAILRSISLFLAFAQMWISRAALDPDGISYSDIAKAYLRGDWHDALSSYWSPLYSWLLALGYWVFRPGIRWEIFVSHVINFIAFAAALFAWEWLFREWERWQGPPSHRAVVQIAGYSVITWAGLHLVNLGFTSADMIVLAITIALGAELVRVRRGASRTSDFVFIGVALGLGFLAKAAFEVLIPVVLVEAALLLHTLRDRRLYLAAALAVLVPLPFVTALSVSRGRFVVSDTGRINYLCAVTGMSIEGWKENAFWPGKAARHPITILMDHPRVTSFESHLVGSTPLHYDPAWWTEGYPLRINWPRQLMIIYRDLGYYVTRFAFCPCLLFVLACVLWRGGRQMLKRLGDAWFLWLPALAVLGVYSLVYSLNRYIAGAFALIAFCLIASGWRLRLPRWVAIVTAAATIAFTVGAFRPEFLYTPRDFFKDAAGKGDPQELENIRVAENLRAAGLHPGDRVALIGNSILTEPLSLLNGTTVATVPETIGYDDRTWGRKQVSTFEKSDEFWRSSPAIQQRVFDAFRSVGAQWVIASAVPTWANTSGWKIAGSWNWPDDGKHLNKMFYRKLD